MLLVMTVTCLLATVLRRRAVAIGLSAAFVVASYIFNVIGAAASGVVADLMRQLSFFSYTQGEEIILGAYDPSSTLALLAVVLVGFALSITMFDRRDIGLIGVRDDWISVFGDFQTDLEADGILGRGLGCDGACWS